MIESNYSGEIQLGEFITVDRYQFGFYIGRGQGDSIQFYSISTLAAFYLGDIKKPYVDYIYGSNTMWRIMKYSPTLLNAEYREIYDNAVKGLELLKQNTKKK